LLVQTFYEGWMGVGDVAEILHCISFRLFVEQGSQISV
jgi:hypothetical protein